MLLLGLPGTGPLADLPAEAVVIVVALDVFDEPDAASIASGQLRKGDRVNVRDADGTGWLAIDPPPDAFCWVEQGAIDVADAQARARVTAERTLARSGNPEARMPGTPRITLSRGAVVRLLNRSPMTLGVGRAQRTWRAIEPPPGDVRHIRAEGVRIEVETRPEAEPAPIAEVRAGYSPPQPYSAMPPPPSQVADAIARIEADHRAVLRNPMEQWHLEGVRKRYEDLLRGATDSASGNAIRTRLDVVARHEGMARDARLIETLLERSRRRDGSLALHRRRLADASSPRAQPYDVKGLIQPSSRKVDGQKVFALIGSEGRTDAYLEIPPGIDVKGLMTRRVGVRGTVHYNEELRARLISVRDVEPLDSDRETLSGNR